MLAFLESSPTLLDILVFFETHKLIKFVPGQYLEPWIADHLVTHCGAVGIISDIDAATTAGGFIVLSYVSGRFSLSSIANTCGKRESSIIP